MRRVPHYAQVSPLVVDSVRQNLTTDEDEARDVLHAAFDRLEQLQPALCRHLSEELTDPLDETSVALGYFLVIGVWLAFERAHGARLLEVNAELIHSTLEALDVDTHLRRLEPAQTLPSSDLVASQQPSIVHFIQEHFEHALKQTEPSVNADYIHQLYDLVLFEILTLSYAVEPPDGYPVSKTEMLA